MALLSAGRFKATVTSCGIQRKGKNNLLAFSAFFNAYEGKDGDEYIPIEGEFGIIGDFYIQKTNGDLNTELIKRLAHVFEWNGDLTTLAAAAEGARCKITVKDETYNGKVSPKVDWLNHIDDGDGGGFTVDNDADVAKQAQAALGSKIRALLGTSTRPATPSRTTAPTPPPSAVAKALHDAHKQTVDSVWNAFEAKMATDGTPKDHVETAWFQFLKETAGTDDPDAVKDWGKAAADLADWSYLPFP